MPNTIYGLKIFSSEQINRLDAYTIEKSGISSLELMEKASASFVSEFIKLFNKQFPITILCGLGNNGGDGMAIARMLLNKGYDVEVYVVSMDGRTASKEFTAEFLKLENLIEIQQIVQKKDIPTFDPNAILIDAILGSGLNRGLSGLLEEVIIRINNSGCKIVAVDIASGLFASKPNLEQAIIQPHYTLTFQLPKLAFFLPQNSFYTGELSILEIGLSQEFIRAEPTSYILLEKKKIASLLKQRAKYSHKGNFGHVLLYAGSKGKMGAALLSAKAALRTGCGLLSLLVEEASLTIAQTSVWEAMCLTYAENDIRIPSINNNYTIGIGPGIGNEHFSLKILETLLKESTKPVVLDADAINLLSENKYLHQIIPPKSIITPHPKEFERLVGTWKNDYERLEKQRGLSSSLNCYVILKGANSSISTPEGMVFFNSSGNPGMATAGSGDVLTGILTSLLAQNYSPEQACLLGVYLHGLAGDLGAIEKDEEGLIASDIIHYLPQAFKELRKEF